MAWQLGGFEEEFVNVQPSFSHFSVMLDDKNFRDLMIKASLGTQRRGSTRSFTQLFKKETWVSWRVINGCWWDKWNMKKAFRGHLKSSLSKFSIHCHLIIVWKFRTHALWWDSCGRLQNRFLKCNYSSLNTRTVQKHRDKVQINLQLRCYFDKHEKVWRA